MRRRNKAECGTGWSGLQAARTSSSALSLPTPYRILVIFLNLADPDGHRSTRDVKGLVLGANQTERAAGCSYYAQGHSVVNTIFQKPFFFNEELRSINPEY